MSREHTLREQVLRERMLREQQEGFARFIHNGTGKLFANTIRANGLTGERRLRIYHNGYVAGLCDALAGVYGVVNKLVGDEYFHYVAERYVETCSSKTGNVHDYGTGFADFLIDLPELETLPYLPDVARLEWHYHSAFHSPIGGMLNIEKLSRVPDSKYEQLTLQISPSCRLLSSQFPILRIWGLNQDENNSEETISLDEGGVNLVIVREGKQIAFHSLEPASFAMLDAISKGVRFAQACEAALEVDQHCDVGQVLQDAVMHRMIVDFSVNE